MSATNTAVKDIEAPIRTGHETVINSTEAADIFGEVIDRARVGERIEVRRYGKARAFVIGEEDYELFVELERAQKGRRK